MVIIIRLHHNLATLKDTETAEVRLITDKQLSYVKQQVTGDTSVNLLFDNGIRQYTWLSEDREKNGIPNTPWKGQVKNIYMSI